MRKLAVLFFGVSILISGSCTKSNPRVQSASILEQEAFIAKDIDVKEFQNLIRTRGNAIILDVRTQAEVDAGHLSNSLHMNFYDNDFKERIAKLDKSKPILVYCHSGYRSGHTMSAMKEMGFKEVYNLEPGIVGWKAAGLPIVK